MIVDAACSPPNDFWPVIEAEFITAEWTDESTPQEYQLDYLFFLREGMRGRADI
jgi:G:T/U-mismatch repair DNA glycosylase